MPPRASRAASDQGCVVHEARGVPAEQPQQLLQARPQALDGARHLDASDTARAAALRLAEHGRRGAPGAGVPSGDNGARCLMHGPATPPVTCHAAFAGRPHQQPVPALHAGGATDGGDLPDEASERAAKGIRRLALD